MPENHIELYIDLGKNEIRQEVAEIVHVYSLNKFGKQVPVIDNLQLRCVFGVQSNVTILAADDEAIIFSPVPERLVKIGSQIK